jgi:hypothetical protein
MAKVMPSANLDSDCFRSGMQTCISGMDRWIGVSESSVKSTLQQLFSKTGVRTRSQLVRIVLIVLEHYRDQI